MELARGVKQVLHRREDISDRFTGYGDSKVSCLALLKGINLEKVSKDEKDRLKFGCTCGRCIGGFLSPRMQDMLLGHAEFTFDYIYTFGDDLEGECWYRENEDLFDYLPKEVRQRLTTRKDLRTGFCMLWKYIADCLRDARLPTEENVLLYIREARERPPNTRTYIQKAGSIASVATMLFEKATQEEESGDIFMADSEMDSDLPVCRNDREIGMVSGLCGYERVTRVKEVTMQGKKIRC
ncbi:hypothetical protein BJY04DRAFT_38921 [Aspergillus karnatakaensis]|uniref:uncharacterized protein n=1 Tax=Aspergillus karnatakaensis TaxID=1810916 RepID=UPI003CCDE4D1